MSPIIDPNIEPNSRLIQQPVKPKNAPMNAKRSRSPCPIPIFPVKR